MKLRQILLSIVDAIAPKETLELPSPKIRITAPQVAVQGSNFLVTNLHDCFVAAIDKTNSEEPYIDEGMYVVLDPTIPHTDLIAGDIIWYELPTFKAIHRITKIITDPTWLAVCQGDNNARPDPYPVPPYAIKGVLRAIVF